MCIPTAHFTVSKETVSVAQNGFGLIAEGVFGVLGSWLVLCLLDSSSPAIQIAMLFQGFGLKVLLGLFLAVRNG